MKMWVRMLLLISFQNQIDQCEKFVFITPEYNGSFPGVLKAFIDGMRFPGTFEGKKCALVGISAGTQGGALAMSHLTDIFNYLGMTVLANKPRLPLLEYKNEWRSNHGFNLYSTA